MNLHRNNAAEWIMWFCLLPVFAVARMMSIRRRLWDCSISSLGNSEEADPRVKRSGSSEHLRPGVRCASDGLNGERRNGTELGDEKRRTIHQVRQCTELRNAAAAKAALIEAMRDLCRRSDGLRWAASTELNFIAAVACMTIGLSIHGTLGSIFVVVSGLLLRLSMNYWQNSSRW